jgi:hypothetical protein
VENFGEQASFSEGLDLSKSAQRVQTLIERELHLHQRVILQVSPNPWQIHDHWDAKGPQVLCWPNPREHQKLRRVVRARTDDHLRRGSDCIDPRRIYILDADSPAAIEQHALCEHPDQQSKI